MRFFLLSLSFMIVNNIPLCCSDKNVDAAVDSLSSMLSKQGNSTGYPENQGFVEPLKFLEISIF